MEINKGIRARIFFFFCVMGIVPLVILTVAAAYNTISDMEESVKQTSLLRNMLVSEHVTELIENLTALTGVDGQQIIRTDGAPSVNIKNRQHFQEALKGRDYVSDIISSMSTGKMIVVIAVPVIDASGKSVGMLQRNFNLVALQDFLRTLDDSENSIIIMDRDGRIIANSDELTGIDKGTLIDDRYKFILEKVYNSSGIIRVEIDGELSLAAYSRNIDTGWMIVTIRPYHYILDLVYERAIKAIIFGAVLMILSTLLAYFLTLGVARPIVEITKAVEDVAAGNIAVAKIDVSRNDELGQMAAAFNKLRSERDAYQLESELDKLTGFSIGRQWKIFAK